MKAKRVVSFILALLTVFLSAGCADSTDTPEAVTTAAPVTTASPINAETTEPEPIFPDEDMDGKEFTIFSEGYCAFDPLAVDDIYREEMSEDPFEDAIFKRLQNVNEKYNCTVRQWDIPKENQGIKTLRTAIIADDGAVDISLIRSMHLLELINSNMVYELTEIPNIDLTQPWWDATSIEQLSVGDSLYAVCSDMTMSDEKDIWCVFYNKQMISDLGLESPNGFVESGKWTYDKMFEMGKKAAYDLNGDNESDERDRYGVHYIIDNFYPIIAGAGITIVEKDNDDLPVFTYDREDNISKSIDIFTDLFRQDECYCWSERLKEGTHSETDMFSWGRVLFLCGGMYYTPGLRNMEQDFGIIPFPKYNEEQETYYSSGTSNFLVLTTVPVINNDLENTGLFMEYFSYLGYKNIRPEYYEVLLKTKVARDNESEAMLDLIFSSRSYDIGGIFNFGNFGYSAVCKLMPRYNENVASFTQGYVKAIGRDIDKLIKKVTE